MAASAKRASSSAVSPSGVDREDNLHLDAEAPERHVAHPLDDAVRCLGANPPHSKLVALRSEFGGLQA